jgi:hypothetical protein
VVEQPVRERPAKNNIRRKIRRELARMIFMKQDERG